MLLHELADAGMAAGAAITSAGVGANLVNGGQSQGGDRLHNRLFMDLKTVADQIGNAFLARR
jgi:hypothetical protein